MANLVEKKIKRAQATHVAWLGRNHRRDPTLAWPSFQGLLLVWCAVTQRKGGGRTFICDSYGWPFTAVSRQRRSWLVRDMACGRCSICCFRSADQSTSWRQLTLPCVVPAFPAVYLLLCPPSPASEGAGGDNLTLICLAELRLCFGKRYVNVTALLILVDAVVVS